MCLCVLWVRRGLGFGPSTGVIGEGKFLPFRGEGMEGVGGGAVEAGDGPRLP
jgi:hypothetical protein